MLNEMTSFSKSWSTTVSVDYPSNTTNSNTLKLLYIKTLRTFLIFKSIFIFHLYDNNNNSNIRILLSELKDLVKTKDLITIHSNN